MTLPMIEARRLSGSVYFRTPFLTYNEHLTSQACPYLWGSLSLCLLLSKYTIEAEPCSDKTMLLISFCSVAVPPTRLDSQ